VAPGDNAARIVGQLVCAYSHETIAGYERETILFRKSRCT
jgi:hypothetical protein